MSVVALRELVAALRSWKALSLQIAFLLCLGLLVVLRWPSDAHVDVEGVASRQVLRVFGYGLMVGLMLVSPAFPATSIVRERVQGTLALLLNSPIQPAALVAGKLAGVLAMVLLFLALSMPAAAACFSMGGIDLTRQLGRLYLVLALFALLQSTLGLLVSSMSRSIDASLRFTYAAVLLLALLPLLPDRLLADASWAGPELVRAAGWLRALSPIPAVVEAIGDTGVGAGGLADTGGATERFCVLAASLSALFIALTILRLDSQPLDRARDAGKVTDDRAPLARALRRVMYLWFFDPQRRSGLIAPWQNPVMVKEQRCRRFGRGNWMMRLVVVYLILSLVLVLAAVSMSKSQGVAAVVGIIVVMQFALILLLAPSLASGLISTERESRGWQLLQMTPMSARTIVTGKLLSAAIPLSMVFIATLPAFGVLVYFDPALLQTALTVLASLVGFAAMAILLSAAVGSCFRNSATATATAYAVLVTLCVGTLLFWLGQDAPFSRRLVERILMVNPLAAALNQAGVSGFTDYRFLPGNWYAIGAVSAFSVMLLATQVRRLSRPQ